MSAEKENPKFIDRLRNRYRLVVMNDDTFEERFSLRLTPLGFLILISVITIIMTTLVVSLVAFTPIREYITADAELDMSHRLDSLNERADSLDRVTQARQLYIDNITAILTGRDTTIIPKNPRDTTKKYTSLDFRPSAADSALRYEIESQDEYSLALNFRPGEGISSFFFFIPVKGVVSNTFNAAEEHFGVDISATDDDEPVRATLDGTVISAGWTTGDGYVIQVQHPNNLVSIYKHNAVLLKKPGEYVKAGDPIAIVGSTGEQITGPHLHFELWYNGAPINPQEYMVF